MMVCHTNIFFDMFPHNIVWGSCFWICTSWFLLLLLLSSSSASSFFHTPSFTQNFVTHHLPHTSLSHTIFHIHLCHPPSFQYTLVTHLSRTTFTHHLCHIPSSTYIFVTHHLSHISWSHTIFHTQLCHTHTTLSHTIFHIHLCHPPSFTYTLVTHLSHTTFTHHLCYTPSFTYRRGTWRHQPSFCVASVALGDIHFRFAWQAWHFWHTTLSHAHLCHTLDKKWSFIGSVGNWIPCKHNQTSRRYQGVLFEVSIGIPRM